MLAMLGAGFSASLFVWFRPCSMLLIPFLMSPMLFAAFSWFRSRIPLRWPFGPANLEPLPCWHLFVLLLQVPNTYASQLPARPTGLPMMAPALPLPPELVASSPYAGFLAPPLQVRTFASYLRIGAGTSGSIAAPVCLVVLWFRGLLCIVLASPFSTIYWFTAHRSVLDSPFFLLAPLVGCLSFRILTPPPYFDFQISQGATLPPVASAAPPLAFPNPDPRAPIPSFGASAMHTTPPQTGSEDPGPSGSTPAPLPGLGVLPRPHEPVLEATHPSTLVASPGPSHPLPSSSPLYADQRIEYHPAEWYMEDLHLEPVEGSRYLHQ
jgi:hypothetical protein